MIEVQKLRVLHTSDLHLGKRLGEASLHEDQRYILDQIKTIVGVSTGSTTLTFPLLKGP